MSAELKFDTFLNRYTVTGDDAEVNEWFSADDRARWDEGGFWIVNKGESIDDLVDVLSADGLTLDDLRQRGNPQ